jgi:hypothetical protein
LRVLYLYPHQDEGQRTSYLVEDYGLSLGYQRGEYTELYFTLTSTRLDLHLEIRYGHHGYRLPYENFEIILPPGEFRPLQVTCPDGLKATMRKCE